MGQGFYTLHNLQKLCCLPDHITPLILTGVNISFYCRWCTTFQRLGSMRFDVIQALILLLLLLLLLQLFSDFVSHLCLIEASLCLEISCIWNCYTYMYFIYIPFQRLMYYNRVRAVFLTNLLIGCEAWVFHKENSSIQHCLCNVSLHLYMRKLWVCWGLLFLWIKVCIPSSCDDWLLKIP